MMYEHIKENFINNFLNSRYRWAVVSGKYSIISNIKDNCPFPISFIDKDDILKIDFGDNVIINIKLIWDIKEVQTLNKCVRYKLMKFE